MPGFHLLLCEVEGAVNLGMAARTAVNFSVESLRYTGDIDRQNHEAQKYAVHAGSFLAGAFHMPDFISLLKGMDLVCAFSTRKPWGKTSATVSLNKLNAYLDANSAPDFNIGLMFGSESHGLTNEQISYANCIVEIPTDDEYRSMNLSQSIAVVLWELRRGDVSIYPGHMPASAQEKALIADKYTALINSAGILNPQNPNDAVREIMHCINGLNLSSRQANLLTGTLNKLKRKMS